MSCKMCGKVTGDCDDAEEACKCMEKTTGLILKDLVTLACRLDAVGLCKEADMIDGFIKTAKIWPFQKECPKCGKGMSRKKGAKCKCEKEKEDKE